MYACFVKLLNMSAAASILIAVVIMLRFLLRKAPKKYICLLWAIAALRLVVPISIASSVSAYNYIGYHTRAGEQIEYIQYNEKSEKPMGEIQVFSGTAAVADTAAVQPHRADFYLPTAMGIWAAGFAAMLGYAALSYLRLCRQTEEAVRYQGRIYRCDHLPSPFILGIIMPKIYLPSELNDPQRQSVIAHEQAHIRRLDHLWKPMGYLILSVHWFNPLVWIGYGLLSRDIESACDERVISKMTNKQKQNYSETLLQCSMPQKFISACPLAFGETGVKQRIKGILNYRRPAAWIVVLSLVVCMCAAATFLTDPVRAETPADGSVDILYELRIGAENVARIAVESPNGSGSCSHADGSAYQQGERILLEPMNNLPDPADVTLRAYTTQDALIWERTIRDTENEADVYNDGYWSLIKLSRLPEDRSNLIVDYGSVITNYGSMSFQLPLKYSYRGDGQGHGTAFITHGTEVLGAVSRYSMETQPRLTDMSWIDSIPFPEFAQNDLYYTAEGLSDNRYTVAFYNNIPETDDGAVRTIHNLFYMEGILYDLWFDELKMDADSRSEILNTVHFTSEVPVGNVLYSAPENGSITVYSSPSEAARKIAELPEEEKLSVLRFEAVGNFYWVYGTTEDGTITGWVKTEDTIETQAPQLSDATLVVGNNITVRSAPSRDARVIAELPAGEELSILQEENVAGITWKYVSSEAHNVIGWVNTEELSRSSGENLLIVRSAPSDDARVIAELPAKEELTLLREESIAGKKWFYASNQAQTIIGWVKMDDEQQHEANFAAASAGFGSTGIGAVNSNGDTLLNVRKGPGIMNPVVSSLQPGDLVIVQDTSVADGQLWGRIGDDEWVCMTYVTMFDSVEATMPTVEDTGFPDDSVILYSSPSVQARVVGTLQPDDDFSVVRSEKVGLSEWHYVFCGDMMGWMEAEQHSSSDTLHHDDVHNNNHH